MKDYDKKPKTSGSTNKSVNGKFGIPSNTLITRNVMLRVSILKIGRRSIGLYMSRPKSSWSNPQNAPPQVQSGQFNELYS